LKLLIRLFTCIYILSLFSCTWSVKDLPINYSSPKQIKLGFSHQSDKSITVKEVEDCREVEDQRIIIYITNDYGDKTGGYYAEKPLATIVREALVDALKVSGLTYSEERNNLSLSGELLDFDHKVISGFVSFTLQTEITVKLTLKDEDNDELLWRDTFFARSSIKGNRETTVIKDGFTAALDDLILQLFSNEIFLEQLRKKLTEKPTRM